MKTVKPISDKVFSRFLSSFTICDVTGCWEWDSATSTFAQGYGLFKATGLKEYLAHRVSYTWFVEPIPLNLHVLHNCPGGDNPLCVNPNHLWVGTHWDNMRDKGSKGRGEPYHQKSRLSEEQVSEILSWKIDKTKYPLGSLKGLTTRIGVDLLTALQIHGGDAMKSPNHYKYRYPWKSWLSNSSFTIKHGVDYHVMPHSMAQMIRNYVAKHKPTTTTSIKIHPDGTIFCKFKPRKVSNAASKN